MHAAVSLAKQGAGLVQEGEFAQAIERFLQSQKITPSPLALYGAGYCFLALNDYSRVVSLASEALITPSLFDDKLKVLLGKAYEGLGDYFLAKSVWDSLETSTKEECWVNYSKSKQYRLTEILKNNEEYLKVLTKNRDRTEVVYLLSQNWVDTWKNYLLYQQQHPGPLSNTGLIQQTIDDPRDYASIVLKPDLIEGIDYSIFNMSAYKLIKDEYGADVDIKRFCTENRQIKQIEINFENLNLQLCPKVSEKYSEGFSFPYSSKETIQEVISACKSLIGPSFDYIRFNFDVFRVWKIGKEVKIDLSLIKIYLPTADLVANFPPVFGTGDAFLFEFQRSDGNWTVYSQLESPCPYCLNLSELSVVCPNCKTIKYCSPGCLDLHKFVHLNDCTQLLDRNGKTGLRNLGNTCYMNSVIQCLSNTLNLRQYFLNKMYLHENPVNGPLTQVFARLIFQMWGVNPGVIFPSEFKRVFCKKFKEFEGVAQQDAHEFLIHFLDGVNDEMKIEDKLSVIGRNFFGEICSEVSCLQCFYKVQKQEQFLTLSLPVVNLEKVQVTVYMVFGDCGKAVIRRVLGCYFSWKLGELVKMMESEFGCEVILGYYDMLDFRGFVLGGDIGEYIGKVIVGYEKQKGASIICTIKGSMGKLSFDRIFFLLFEDFQELIFKINEKIFEIFQVPQNSFTVQIFNNEQAVESLKNLKIGVLKAVVQILDNYKAPRFNQFSDSGYVNIECPGSFDVISALRMLTEGETLDEGNQWYCENCERKSKAIKVGRITNFPKILVLQLMKFKSSLGKLDTFVDFPLDGLDLNDFGVDCKYDLYAVCNHYGSYMFGHYTAYVKSDDGWYEMDDSSVNSLALGRVVSANAYLLFYMKK